MTETPPEGSPRRRLALRILRYPLTLLVIEAIGFTFAGSLLERAGVFKRMGLPRPAIFLATLAGSLLFILLWKAARR